MKFLSCIFLVFEILHNVQSVPFIVQSLSSSYAIVLGGKKFNLYTYMISIFYLQKWKSFLKGFGPGYKENRDVEIVKHDKVCPDAIKWDFVYIIKKCCLFTFCSVLFIFFPQRCTTWKDSFPWCHFRNGGICQWICNFLPPQFVLEIKCG